MTTISHRWRWRRVLALCAATVVLHYLVLDGPARPPAPPAAVAPLTVQAELRAAPPMVAPEAAAETGAAQSLPQVQLNKAPPAVRPALPPYRASPPPAVNLEYDLLRTDASGVGTAGEGRIAWRPDGEHYRLMTLTMLDGSALLALSSEGMVDAGGLVPRTLHVQRRGKAGTATHFDRQRGRITYSATESGSAMAAGAQDKASWPLQLAAIARADPAQLARGVTLPVGEEKDASEYRFVLQGQEALETALGTLATWHLACIPAAGSYRPRLDVWLAPGQQWYPVRLRNTEASGTIITQTIRAIRTDVANDAGT